MEKMTTQWHRQPHFSTSKGISIFVRSALPFFFVHSWTRKCPDIYIVPFLFSSLWDKTLYYDHQHSDVAAVRPLWNRRWCFGALAFSAVDISAAWFLETRHYYLCCGHTVVEKVVDMGKERRTRRFSTFSFFASSVMQEAIKLNLG